LFELLNVVSEHGLDWMLSIGKIFAIMHRKPKEILPVVNFLSARAQ
jgi:hypothetical protein